VRGEVIVCVKLLLLLLLLLACHTRRPVGGAGLFRGGAGASVKPTALLPVCL